MLGVACALSYQSWKPFVAEYSISYIAGVLFPILVLVVLQVALSLWRPNRAAPRLVPPARVTSILVVATLFAQQECSGRSKAGQPW
jgi:hypothetical protein